MHHARTRLKAFLVPQLRELGFKGSFPHFRRERNQRNELLTIQFDKNGTGQFVVELASAPTGAFKTYWGKEIPKSKLTAHDSSERLRLEGSPQKDSWFSDEALLGKWQGYRSSRPGIKYRVIYQIEATKILVKVIDLTPHDYRKK